MAEGLIESPKSLPRGSRSLGKPNYHHCPSRKEGEDYGQIHPNPVRMAHQKQKEQQVWKDVETKEHSGTVVGR